jgi:hypothetical protein
MLMLTQAVAAKAANSIRKVQAKPDGIININTGLGIATIIQLPETIQSVIIGDQSGFKLEYLDRAVTIKPLRWGARTNLYLVTEKQRYNLRILTLKQETADFIVYVESQKEETAVNWRAYDKKVQTNTFTLEITKIGKNKAGFIILDGKLSTNRFFTIKPEQFWIYQDKESKTINGLYLSELRLVPKKPIQFGISLAASDLVPNKPVTLEIHLLEPLSLEIPKEFLWK